LNYKDHIVIDSRYIRPTEVDALIGDPSKAEKVLGWKAKTKWEELARIMVDADVAQLRKSKLQ
jgi:GDPmannose 4,6-dehydratase